MKIRLAIACLSTVAILTISVRAQTLIYVKLDPLTGTVVRFNKAEMDGSTRGDLIVRVAGQKQFVRLVYCPLNCGIDVPQRTEPLPEQMTSRGDLVWTFGVHSPEGGWERGTCSDVPKIFGRGKKPFEVVIERGTPFVPTPGHDRVQVPAVESLPCYVIGKWAIARGSIH